MLYGLAGGRTCRKIAGPHRGNGHFVSRVAVPRATTWVRLDRRKSFFKLSIVASAAIWYVGGCGSGEAAWCELRRAGVLAAMVCGGGLSGVSEYVV